MILVSTAEDAGLWVRGFRVGGGERVLLPGRQGRVALLAAGDQGGRDRESEQKREGGMPFHRKRSRAAAAALRTFSGAVPPKLVRLAAECSGERTVKRSAVIFGSTDCISESES